MTAKSALMRPQGLRPRPRAPTCPLATPLAGAQKYFCPGAAGYLSYAPDSKFIDFK